MNLKRLLPALLGILLFFGGIAVSLSFSAVLLWGEMEARLYAPQNGDKSLKIECPLVIAPQETGTIKTVITNTLTHTNTKPQINALISQKEGEEARLERETLELAPLESRAMQWTVNGSDIIFNRLILVNIFQRPYRELPSRQGVCSILVYSLFGLNGERTLYTIVAAATLAGLFGAWLLFFLHRPFTGALKNFAQVSFIFQVLALLGLASALYRLWGLTLAFDAAAMLAFASGSIEIFFPRKK